MACDAVALVALHEELEPGKRALRRGRKSGRDGERAEEGGARAQLIFSAFSADFWISSCARSSRSRDSAMDIS